MRRAVLLQIERASCISFCHLFPARAWYHSRNALIQINQNRGTAHALPRRFLASHEFLQLFTFRRSQKSALVFKFRQFEFLFNIQGLEHSLARPSYVLVIARSILPRGILIVELLAVLTSRSSRCIMSY